MLGTFLYKPEQDWIFGTRFSRNKAIVEESTKADRPHVQLLLKALGATEYSRLLSRLSPIQPETKKYAELVQILKTTFGPSKSIFRRRHDILSQQAPLTALEDPEDIVDWANLKGGHGMPAK